ncbi:MAG: S41 family peptidase, partial [Solirubrobacteraceae bacterium]
PEVRFAGVIYLAMAVFVVWLFIDGWRSLRGFEGLAKSIRGRRDEAETFTALNRVPELDGVAGAFDRMVGALRDSAEMMRYIAEDNAHAFKTPIAVIAQSIEPLKRAVLSDDRRSARAVQMIEQSVERLDTLVSAADVEDWLAGNDGSRVELRVVGALGRRTLRLTRAQVPEENVFSFRDGPGLLVRITDFNTHTAARLVLAIEQGFATSDRPAGIVLDLRGNRGGLLYQAARSADEFLPAGLVATTEGRDPAADHVFRSHRPNVAPALPLVVLVDGRTASAAEVMAAALADRDRGVVVGSSTLGKGLVQIVTRLPDGGELLLTWSRILAPRGWPLQGLGVLPQVCTSLGETTALDQV